MIFIDDDPTKIESSCEKCKRIPIASLFVLQIAQLYLCNMRTLKDQLAAALKERLEGKQVKATAIEAGISEFALTRLAKGRLPSIVNLSDQLEALGLEVTVTVKK